MRRTQLPSTTSGLLLLLLSAAFAACGGGGDGAPRSDAGAGAAATGAPDAAAPADDGAVAELDAVDLLALAEVARAYDASRAAASEIWAETDTGMAYRFHEMPMLLVRRDAAGVAVKAYLFNHPSPPADAVPVSHPAVASLGTFHRHDAGIAVAEYGFDFDVPIAGVSSFLFSYSEDESDDFSPAAPWFLGFLVHEAFHRYQLVEGAWTVDPEWTQDEASYPLTRDHVALVLLEIRVLLAGLRATDAAGRERALRQMVAIRAARRALPDVVVGGVNFVEHYDGPQENVEGTAHYVERVFGDLADRPTEPALDAWLTEVLERPYETAADVRAELAFGRFYLTGGALGFLLDGLDGLGGTDWKSLAATEGASPIAAAELRFPLDEAQRAAALDEARMEHDFPSLETRATELLALP